MLKLFASKQFVAFVITGGIAALVNFSSRIVYNQFTGFSTAIVLAYISGMITAFILAKCFVFTNSRHSTQKSALFFTLVNIVAVLQTWLISVGLAYYVLPWLGVSHYVKEISHAIGVMVPVFSSYIGHKYLTFR